MHSDSTKAAYADAAARYRVVLAQEESFWAQKARQKWLKEGDRNTAFFQATVKERRQFSLCTSILQDDGSYLTDLDRIASSGVNYIRAQFNAPQCASFTTLVHDYIPSLVTDADNAALLRFPTLEEVHEVVNQMDHSSASGPDGFNGKLYSTCWDIIGQDLHQAVLSFF